MYLQIMMKKKYLSRIQKKKRWTRTNIHQTVPVPPDVFHAQPWVNIEEKVSTHL